MLKMVIVGVCLAIILYMVTHMFYKSNHKAQIMKIVGWSLLALFISGLILTTITLLF